MLINETPVKTCVNYGINDFNLKDVKTLTNVKNFEGYSLNNCLINKLEKVETIKNKLSEELFNQSVEFCNFNYKIDLQENSGLDFNFNKENNTLIGNIEINVKENENKNLTIKFLSNEECYNNTIIKVNGEKNSKLNLVVFCNLEQISTSLIAIEQNLQNNAQINLNIVDFSVNASVYNVYSNQKENTNSKINCVYLESENAFLDLNINNDIFGKNSVCDIKSVGVLKDKAKKNFKGTINFQKGCKKSKGTENEFCMLLSKDVKSKALPMLLCLEEDVEGNHSTSVGKIDDKQMFYLMTRGLSYTEALKLIIKAKISNVLNEINDENIQKEITEIFDRKLNYEIK